MATHECEETRKKGTRLMEWRLTHPDKQVCGSRDVLARYLDDESGRSPVSPDFGSIVYSTQRHTDLEIQEKSRKDDLQVPSLGPRDGHADGICFIRDCDCPATSHTSRK